MSGLKRSAPFHSYEQLLEHREKFPKTDDKLETNKKIFEFLCDQTIAHTNDCINRYKKQTLNQDELTDIKNNMYDHEFKRLQRYCDQDLDRLRRQYTNNPADIHSLRLEYDTLLELHELDKNIIPNREKITDYDLLNDKIHLKTKKWIELQQSHEDPEVINNIFVEIQNLKKEFDRKHKDLPDLSQFSSDKTRKKVCLETLDGLQKQDLADCQYQEIKPEDEDLPYKLIKLEPRSKAVTEATLHLNIKIGKVVRIAQVVPVAIFDKDSHFTHMHKARQTPFQRERIPLRKPHSILRPPTTYALREEYKKLDTSQIGPKKDKTRSWPDFNPWVSLNLIPEETMEEVERIDCTEAKLKPITKRRLQSLIQQGSYPQPQKPIPLCNKTTRSLDITFIPWVRVRYVDDLQQSKDPVQATDSHIIKGIMKAAKVYPEGPPEQRPTITSSGKKFLRLSHTQTRFPEDYKAEPSGLCACVRNH